jgi:exosortase A
MPPEITLARRSAWLERIPQAWRVPLLQLALAWAALLLLTWAQWSEMADQWWNSSTYNHVVLVPAILVWLVRLRWGELTQLFPQAWWPGLGWFGAGLIAWMVGMASGINTAGELGAVMLLQGATLVLWGPRVAAGLLFPLGYMLFLVPFGGEIIPPLQAITARIAVALTHLSGVPATLSGVFIDTPVGRFEVAEACSGVKFLIAMIALGTLVAHMGFRSAQRRALFMAACGAVPVLANGIRAWGTIYVAQSRGVAFAAGFDHIVYGWIFFALVMAAVLGAAWRFFDRPAEDNLVDVAGIERSRILGALARFEIGGWRVLGAMVLAGMAVSLWGVSLTRPLVEGLLAAVGVHP